MLSRILSQSILNLDVRDRFIFFVLFLLQLAHHPTKDSGKGLSLLRALSIPPGKAETDIAHFREIIIIIITTRTPPN